MLSLRDKTFFFSYSSPFLNQFRYDLFGEAERLQNGYFFFFERGDATFVTLEKKNRSSSFQILVSHSPQ